MLMNWSSPFVEDSHLQKKKTKITNSKQLETLDEDSLSDYHPPKMEKINKKFAMPEPMPDTPTEADVNVYEAPLMTQTYKTKESELMEKLNYMIYLLEEQRDERTSHITEELILYVFLGIFTLFVLDAFVKTGKYSR
jgi:hypothetical protein